MKTPVAKSSDLHVTIDKEAKVTEDEDENENGSEHPNSPHQKKGKRRTHCSGLESSWGALGSHKDACPNAARQRREKPSLQRGVGAPSSQSGRQQPLFLRTEVREAQDQMGNMTSLHMRSHMTGSSVS